MLKGLEIVGRADVPVSQGAAVPLVNSEVMTERWEALYGKLTWKGAWMKHWVEPTQQSEPPYHRPPCTKELLRGEVDESHARRGSTR